MSLTTEVYLHRSSLPDADAWSRQMNAHGFPIRFEMGVDLKVHSGYLPAKWKNRSAGFEYWVDAIDPQSLPAETLPLLGERDTVVELSYTESIEARSAITAAAVLAAMTNGIYRDAQSEKLAMGEVAIAAISEEYAELERDLAKTTGMTRGQWQREFLPICQAVNPDYAINRDLSGRMTEMFRSHETGLVVSHNCIKAHSSYYHGFALLFSKFSFAQLRYPLLAGDRFDHNATVGAALLERGKERLATGSFHAGRRGWEEFAQETVTSAGSELMPLLLAELQAGWTNLHDLFTHALDLSERLDLDDVSLDIDSIPKKILEYATERLGEPPHRWSRDIRRYVIVIARIRTHELGYDLEAHWTYRQQAVNLKATEVANPMSRPARLYREIPASLRPTCAFLSNLEIFVAVRKELPYIIGICERLRDYHSPEPRGKFANLIAKFRN